LTSTTKFIIVIFTTETWDEYIWKWGNFCIFRCNRKWHFVVPVL